MPAAPALPPSESTDPRTLIPSADKAKPKSAPQKAMEKLGLQRDIDRALHLPLRYEDETRLTPMRDLRPGVPVQVEGTVSDCQIQLRPRRQLVVSVSDGTETLVLRFLNFYPSHQKSLSVGSRVRVKGEVRDGFFGLEMVHPTFKTVDDDTPLAVSLTPVYPSVATLPQTYLRKAVLSGLAHADLSEIIPADLLPKDLPSLREALRTLHQPPPDVSLAALEDRTHPAWQRLKFEELLAQQLSQLKAKQEREQQRAPGFRIKAGGLQEQLLASLPFSLTSAQRRVAEEIGLDLQRGTDREPASVEGLQDAIPMHRLLQGDVGSGKTVVAALAAAVVMDAGWQCALMAPTEILAEQHFNKLVQWLDPLLAPLGASVAWLTGSRKGKDRQKMLDAVASGQARLIVGTHAVIQQQVEFARLGLAIIDEQHRFGVQQRLALRHKLEANGWVPHLLMMSATPIPRTLAMTVFADLDISTIDELPPGRTPIVTKVFGDARRDDVIRIISAEVAKGRQVYWVCPLIDESETLDLQNATATHQQLCGALPGRMVGLLHGRMPSAEKAAVMSLFAGGQMNVMVATTVIEVGVDVPNASLMVIEHAERFGLSQLHQLRGRVGRGSVASVCVLLYTAPLSPTGKARLKAMAETDDGFDISRRDLEIRGPGEFLGARQSGVPLLRFADLALDEALVQEARSVASAWMARQPEAAERHVSRWLGGKAQFLNA
ncbi:MAG: ATP-dependent helicase RecG [Rhizobacter sp.]|nr:ATP-dependent helicase RecG [Rhizobacter sp.]